MLINMHPFFQDPQAGDAPHGLSGSLNAHFQGVGETDLGFGNSLGDPGDMMWHGFSSSGP
jgi:hypothetical protein